MIQVLLALTIFLGLLAYYLFYIAPKLNPLNRAENFLKQDRVPEAVIEYKKALDANPDDFVVHYRLAGLYYTLKEADQAILHLEEVLRINKYNYEVEKLEVERKLAGSYFARDDMEKAFQIFLDILKVFPGDEETLYQVSFILLGQEEFEIGQKYFDRLARIAKDDFDCLFGAGICSYQNQKINDSIAYFKTAVTLRPQSDIANLALAFALQKGKDYRQAAASAARVADTALDPPVKFISKRLLAFLHIQARKAEEGIRVFEEMLDFTKKNDMQEELLMTLYDIGFACIRAERSSHAYDYWNELYQLDKSFKNVQSLVTLLRRELEADAKRMKDDLESPVSESVENWIANAFPANFLWEICGLKSDRKVDLRNIMVTTRISLGKDDALDGISSRDDRDRVEAFSALDSENFRILSNRVVSKIGYKVDQILQTYREADGVDFLAYSLQTKEKALIWVRRWTQTRVGEIPLRNFAQAINDMKAREGLFITAADLTDGAVVALKQLSKVTVVQPAELNALLKDLI